MRDNRYNQFIAGDGSADTFVIGIGQYYEKVLI